jgi:hypothetical protein
MLFLVYWMCSLGVWAVIMAFWYGVALFFSLPMPTDGQVAGTGWIIMALSQVAAVATIVLICIAEDREMKRRLR